MNGLLHVSSSPHARSKVTTDKIMFAVLLALAPAACVGVWNFGLRALLLIAISMAVCPLTEYLYEKGMKKPVTIADGSALVTGLLLAMNMPVQAPLWMPVIGGVFAILVVKQLFGGLGQNIMNPALAGRCFLLISFPGHMTNFAAGSRTPRGYRIRCDTARRSKSRRAGESAVHVPWKYGRNDR